MADKLAESEDVDMATAGGTGRCGDGYDVATIDELSAKFSVQGTSSSKTSGKKKVVCIHHISGEQCTRSVRKLSDIIFNPLGFK